jgi:hypothetical protein
MFSISFIACWKDRNECLTTHVIITGSWYSCWCSCVLLTFSLVFISFDSPFFCNFVMLRCFKSAPFCPSTSVTVSTFLNICSEFTSRTMHPSKVKVVDLGSGSGTVLFAAAKKVYKRPHFQILLDTSS